MEVEDLTHSSPKDRHYVVDRKLGDIDFGDGVRGAKPPSDATFGLKFGDWSEPSDAAPNFYRLRVPQGGPSRFTSAFAQVLAARSASGPAVQSAASPPSWGRSPPSSPPSACGAHGSDERSRGAAAARLADENAGGFAPLGGAAAVHRFPGEDAEAKQAGARVDALDPGAG